MIAIPAPFSLITLVESPPPPKPGGVGGALRLLNGGECVLALRALMVRNGPLFALVLRMGAESRRCALYFPHMCDSHQAQASGVAARPPRADSRSSKGRLRPTLYMASTVWSKPTRLPMPASEV